MSFSIYDPCSFPKKWPSALNYPPTEVTSPHFGGVCLQSVRERSSDQCEYRGFEEKYEVVVD